jgi:hypothetical protein
MALPTLEYPWRFKNNIDLNTTGTLLGDYRQLLLTIKNSLITNTGWTDSTGVGASLTIPWTVVASSDGVITADLNDNWLAVGNLVWAAAPTAHSWIVLRQIGINGANVDLCIDLSNATESILTLAFSFGVGFDVSSPTVNNRPTATDELVRTNITWLGLAAPFSSILNVAVSDRGECTRVFAFVAGVCKAFWCFDKPKNPVSGWTNPAVLTINSNSEPLFITLNDTALAGMRANNINGYAIWTTEFCSTQTTGQLLTTVNCYTLEWPISKIGIAVTSTGGTSGIYGFHGEFSDIWFGSVTPVSGDTYSILAPLKQFIQVGDVILPWDRSTPVLT